MEKKIKFFDIIKWLFLLPISMLLAVITSGATNKLVSFLENYLFGDDFFHYYWSLFCVSIYGAIYGFFLSATTYFIAPNYKERSCYIIVTIVLFFAIFGNNDFSNEYFYIRGISTLIIGIITPNIIEENEENIIITLFGFFTVLILGVWLVSSLILHFWTVKLAFHNEGVLGAFVSFFLPVISELFYLFKQWNANDGYVRLSFMVLILSILRQIISKIISS